MQPLNTLLKYPSLMYVSVQHTSEGVWGHQLFAGSPPRGVEFSHVKLLIRYDWLVYHVIQTTSLAPSPLSRVTQSAGQYMWRIYKLLSMVQVLWGGGRLSRSYRCVGLTPRYQACTLNFGLELWTLDFELWTSTWTLDLGKVYDMFIRVVSWNDVLSCNN